MNKKYYFDYNATTPVYPEVAARIDDCFRDFYANPSSLHSSGKEVAKQVRDARKSVVDLMSAEDVKTIVFTSGGTESNNLAMHSAAKAFPERNEIITSQVEHSSVLKLCQEFESRGYKVHYISVDREGKLNEEELSDKLSKKTALVSLMSSNNETGVVFEWEKIGQEVKAMGALFHVDAVQSLGKLPIDVTQGQVDYLTFSGHKLYAPKGIGGLYVSPNAPFTNLIYGGGQERGRRPGTENVSGILGLGLSCRMHAENLLDIQDHLERVRDLFEREVLRRIENTSINGGGQKRLPNTSNVCFRGVDGESLLYALDQEGIQVSAGSACMSGSHEPSHVLSAMGLSHEDANSSVRFSFGEMTKEAEVDSAVSILAKVIKELRK